jgi:hypothetical protein
MITMDIGSLDSSYHKTPVALAPKPPSLPSPAAGPGVSCEMPKFKGKNHGFSRRGTGEPPNFPVSHQVAKLYPKISIYNIDPGKPAAEVSQT